MGTEYIIMNLEKKEFLDFSPLGFGTKIGATTSEPFTSFLSWLLINPEGYGPDFPPMLGRWAGDRIEIVGDGDEGYERQEMARKEFRDITVEAIKGFSDGSPMERIAILQPMGLIDKNGNVVADSRARESVGEYWKEMAEQEDEERDRFLAEQLGGSPLTSKSSD